MLKDSSGGSVQGSPRATRAVGAALLFGAAALSLVHASDGRVWSDEQVLERPINPSEEHRVTPWPAHRIIGNVYYVGTRNLGSFLITTPEGHILVNTTFEHTLPLVRKSVEDLGFAWEDVKILLGSHAHPDHMEADALAKAETGAQVMAMGEDIPLLVMMKPGGKPHPIDRVLKHGDTVSLGDTRLTAHLAPGHTPGTTTWTLLAKENGRAYHVVILGGATPTPRMDVTDPRLQAQFQQAFLVQRALPCDVPLGPHVPMYDMEAKFANLDAAAANPYIDPAGCQEELGLSERTFYVLLMKQLRAKREADFTRRTGGSADNT